CSVATPPSTSARTISHLEAAADESALVRRYSPSGRSSRAVSEPDASSIGRAQLFMTFSMITPLCEAHGLVGGPRELVGGRIPAGVSRVGVGGGIPPTGPAGVSAPLRYHSCFPSYI